MAGARNTYYIIAMDHIQDMRTRAIGASKIRTVGESSFLNGDSVE